MVHKKCIFLNISKTCLKELGILLKCRETLKNLLQPVTLLKINLKKKKKIFFFQRFLATVFKKYQFLNKNLKVPLC